LFNNRQHDAAHLGSTSVRQSLGWFDYCLPDGTVYYVHPTLGITTDIDLRNQRKLQAVSTYLEDDEGLGTSKGVGNDLEIWLSDATVLGEVFKPLRRLVDHKARSVNVEASSGRHEDDKDREFLNKPNNPSHQLFLSS
jgi:hypothetical protein